MAHNQPAFAAITRGALPVYPLSLPLPATLRPAPDTQDRPGRPGTGRQPPRGRPLARYGCRLGRAPGSADRLDRLGA